MTKQEYIQYRLNNDTTMLIIEYYKDIKVFKEDADINRIVEFLQLMDSMYMLSFNLDEIIRHFDEKFEIMYIIKDNVIIGIR